MLGNGGPAAQIRPSAVLSCGGDRKPKYHRHRPIIPCSPDAPKGARTQPSGLLPQGDISKRVLSCLGLVEKWRCSPHYDYGGGVTHFYCQLAHLSGNPVFLQCQDFMIFGFMISTSILFCLITPLKSPAQPVIAFTLRSIVDKPWSQVSSLPHPPGTIRAFTIVAQWVRHSHFSDFHSRRFELSLASSRSRAFHSSISTQRRRLYDHECALGETRTHDLDSSRDDIHLRLHRGRRFYCGRSARNSCSIIYACTPLYPLLASHDPSSLSPPPPPHPSPLPVFGELDHLGFPPPLLVSQVPPSVLPPSHILTAPLLPRPHPFCNSPLS